MTIPLLRVVNGWQIFSAAWTRDGVVEHEKKAVEGVSKEEIQGVMVDGVRGCLGVSLQKRGILFEAGMYFA